MGVVPVEDPEILALIMVDSPKYPNNQGGSAAAPAFRKFVGRIAPMIGLRPNVNPLDFMKKETKRMAENETVRNTW